MTRMNPLARVMPASASAHTSELQPGEKLDHYLVEALVARGDMASVFRCLDLKTSGAVAIKVPHPGAESDAEFVTRFARETETCRRLDHPSIVKVLASESSSRRYMVMEWAAGQSLRQILREEGRLGEERAIRLALKICAALEYAQGQGIVHPDLRSENIMVDGEEHIKILDLGVALKTNPLRWLQGSRRSDVSALGVILYEMVMGELPFRGLDPLRIMYRRFRHRPVSPREMNAAISPELRAVLYRALHSNPRSRYRNVHEFALALKRVDQVEVPNRDGRRSRASLTASAYVMLVMIPIMVFGLLLFVARFH